MVIEGVEMTPEDIARFWSNVDSSGGEDACWPWKLVCNEKGYGLVRIKRKNKRAHRVAYAITLGEEIPDGVKVLHDCDNPPCCNPKHLFTGTCADNTADMLAKGRGRGAERKLNDAQRAEVVELRAGGMTQQRIADRYGVTQSAISRILHVNCAKRTSALAASPPAGVRRPP
jgi:hypothetical protein